MPERQRGQTLQGSHAWPCMSQSSIICEPLEDTSATVSRTRAFQALCGVDLKCAKQGLSQRQISNFTHCVKRQSQQSAVAKRVIGLSTVYAIVSLPTAVHQIAPAHLLHSRSSAPPRSNSTSRSTGAQSQCGHQFRHLFCRWDRSGFWLATTMASRHLA